MSLPRLECIAAAAADARLRLAARAPPRPPTTSGSCAPSTASPSGSPSRACATRAAAPLGARLAGVSGRDAARGRLRRGARGGVGAGIPAAIWGSTGCCAPSSTPTSRRRRSPAAASTPRSRSPPARLEAAHVITGHTHRAGPREDEAAGRCRAAAASTTPAAGSSPPPSTTRERRPGPTGRGGHLGRGRGAAATGSPAGRPSREELRGDRRAQALSRQPLGDDRADLLAGVLLEEVARRWRSRAAAGSRAARRRCRRPRGQHRVGVGPEDERRAARPRAARRRPLCPPPRRARRARSAGSAGRPGRRPSTRASG